MNKRAKQLAIESGFGVDAAEQAFNGQVLNNSLERFYNKIVQECVSICDAAANNCADQVTPLMADKLVVAGAKEQAAKLSQCIKEHFGVE